MVNISIRQYQESDNEQVKNLHRIALISAAAFDKSGTWDSDLDSIQETYLNGGDFLVGLLNNQIIVMGALRRISQQVSEIKRMRVHPDFQGQGLGKMMLGLLEKKAKKLGYTIIQLDTTLKQVTAQKMYEKNGYVEIRRESEGWPMEMIFYQKNLQ